MYKYISRDIPLLTPRERKLSLSWLKIMKGLHKQNTQSRAYCNRKRIKMISAVKTVIAKHTILFLALF